MLLRKLKFVWIFTFSLAFASYSERADCNKAKTYFQKAKDIGSDTAGLIQNEQFFIKAIELCPSYVEAHNNLGDVYEKQGRFEEAIAEYRKTIELNPDAPYPYFGLGDIYYKTNRYKEAVEWYAKGLKYDPNDQPTIKTLALLKDIQKDSVIKAETIRGMFSTTRGAGEVVSITFGEGLIPFDFNEYNIRHDAESQLNEVGKALKDLSTNSKDVPLEPKNRTIPVFEIAGHTDCIGTDTYNIGLSEKRARSVADYLTMKFNIPAERLKPIGYGERKPISAVSNGLCKSEHSNEGYHALNRRVEIAKKTGEIVTEGGTTRSVTRGIGGMIEQRIILDTGMFYQKKGENMVNVLKEDSRLRSRLDKYFIYFRPLQDCYAYIIQEDSKGKVDLLFPEKNGNPFVRKGQDYWVPSPFGNARELDDTKGEEKIYLLTTSWQLKTEIEEISLKEQVRGAIKSLKTRSTRIIKVVPVSQAVETIPEEELKTKRQKIDSLVERVEGEGGWVKVVRFGHE